MRSPTSPPAAPRPLHLLALLALWGGPLPASAPPSSGEETVRLGLAAVATQGERMHRPAGIGPVRQGEATFYDANGEGNCSFDATEERLVAALNTRDYAQAALCGGYLSVSGPNGTVVVRVTDRCPGCKQGGLDLSREAFARIADPASGRVAVSWQLVAGPVDGPVVYRYMDGSSRFWTAIQLRNHRLPIASLAIRPAGHSEWLPVSRRRYNYFVHPSPIPAGPVQVRVRATNGAELIDTLPEPGSVVEFTGSTQFR